MDMPFQARVDDAVGHSEEFFGQVVGFGVGVAICAALIVGGVVAAPFSGGMSLAASIVGLIGLLAICEASAGAGGFIAKLFGPTKTGKIKSGAQTVFVGAARKAAARETDPVECQDTALTAAATAMLLTAAVFPVGALLTPLFCGAHEPAEISSGSNTVRIEGKRAARVTSKLDCDGVVVEGEKTVFTFGEPGTSGKPLNIGWVPWLFASGLFVIKWGSMFVGNPKAIAQTGIRYIGRWGWKKGSVIIGKRALRSLRTSSWGRKLLGALDLHDSYANITELIVDDERYNFANDLYGVGGNEDVRDGAVRLGRRILRRP